MLTIADKAPDFELTAQNGQVIKLSDYLGKYVVLFFYPKDMTPGCTIEACSFRDLNDEIQKAGAVILGIGGGNEKSKVKFVERHKLNFPLLIDIGNKVSKEYGTVSERSIFGKKFTGISRVTYLIDPNGLIVYKWEKVNPLNHTNDVLKKINELNA
ncbi:thioredoxin-dependent thiol peroxidase [Candidatus Dojkabacteria bacterium]|nr:thioredoxin-dependent thiol peroxidase [Candidatus Dojkabacteria bacterium]